MKTGEEWWIVAAVPLTSKQSPLSVGFTRTTQTALRLWTQLVHHEKEAETLSTSAIEMTHTLGKTS